MRLVRSSDPDAVARDQALSSLAERAVLTRMVCSELREAPETYATRRTRTALFELLRWVGEHHPEQIHGEPPASDGLDQMAHADGTEALVAEIRDGARVCDALFMLLTADRQFQADGDRARLRAGPDAYRAEHPSAAATPLR